MTLKKLLLFIACSLCMLSASAQIQPIVRIECSAEINAVVPGLVYIAAHPILNSYGTVNDVTVVFTEHGISHIYSNVPVNPVGQTTIPLGFNLDTTTAYSVTLVYNFASGISVSSNTTVTIPILGKIYQGCDGMGVYGSNLNGGTWQSYCVITSLGCVSPLPPITVSGNGNGNSGNNGNGKGRKP